MTIHEIYLAWMQALGNGTVEGHWLVFLLVMLAIAEGLFVIITKTEKRYKESLVGYTTKFKFLSIFLSIFMFFGVWALGGFILLILANFMKVVMTLGIVLLAAVAVTGWIVINYWIAKANVKEQKFTKGEKLVARQSFEGDYCLTKGETVTYLGVADAGERSIRVQKKNGKINENKWHRFDKLK